MFFWGGESPLQEIAGNNTASRIFDSAHNLYLDLILPSVLFVIYKIDLAAHLFYILFRFTLFIFRLFNLSLLPAIRLWSGNCQYKHTLYAPPYIMFIGRKSISYIEIHSCKHGMNGSTGNTIGWMLCYMNVKFIRYIMRWKIMRMYTKCKMRCKVPCKLYE